MTIDDGFLKGINEKLLSSVHLIETYEKEGLSFHQKLQDAKASIQKEYGEKIRNVSKMVQLRSESKQNNIRLGHEKASIKWGMWRSNRIEELEDSKLNANDKEIKRIDKQIQKHINKNLEKFGTTDISELTDRYEGVNKERVDLDDIDEKIEKSDIILELDANFAEFKIPLSEIIKHETDTQEFLKNKYLESIQVAIQNLRDQISSGTTQLSVHSTEGIIRGLEALSDGIGSGTYPLEFGLDSEQDYMYIFHSGS
jgi:hypothetical protein